MDKLPKFGEIIPSLLRIDCSRFSLEDLEESCEALGWSKEGDEELGVFRITDSLCLYAFVEDGQVWAARVVLSWWEDWLPRRHKTRQGYEAARCEFDELYFAAREVVVQSLGLPFLEGQEEPDDDDTEINGLILNYHHACWRSRNGLLILQQGEFDIQFGVEINLWLQPWNPTDPVPTFPLG